MASNSRTSRNKVLKSRSSNDAIVKQSTRITHRELPLKVLKKRGVYVEKKLTSTNIGQGTRQTPSCSRAPEHQSQSGRQSSTSPRLNRQRSLSPTNRLNNVKRPKTPKIPDRNKFITSVLNVLDQNTASTQISATLITEGKLKKQLPVKWYDEALKREGSFSKGERKYRSKTLEKNCDESRPVVVLQPKKVLIQTPSLYSKDETGPSASNSVRYTGVRPINDPIYKPAPAPNKRNTSIGPINDSVINYRQMSASKTPYAGIRVINDPFVSNANIAALTRTSEVRTGMKHLNEPLVYNSGTPSIIKEPNHNVKKKKTKSISLSSQRNRSDRDRKEQSVKVLKLADPNQNDSENSRPSGIVTAVLEGLCQEIPNDEVVKMEAIAKTERKENENIYDLFLSMLKESRCKADTAYHNLPDRESSAVNLVKKPSTAPVVYFEDEDANDYQDDRTYSNLSLSLINTNAKYVIQGHSPLVRRKPQMNTKRFLVPPKKKEEAPKKLQNEKKSQKRDLLALIKRELTANVKPIAEPTNIYEALQLIIKNKIKCHRQTRFSEPRKTTATTHGDPECMFKGKRVLSRKRYSYKPKNPDSGDIILSPFDSERQLSRVPEVMKPDTSDHSMKVYAYKFLNKSRVKDDVSSDENLEFDNIVNW